MRQDGFISKMEDLERWFDLNNQGEQSMPYFTIYRGYQAKPDSVIYRNTEISDAAKAWEMLDEILTAHSDSGGSFRIYITSKPGFNVGMNTLLKLPNPHGNAMAGINGAQSGAYGIYGSMQEMVKAEIDRGIEMYELKRELEDMRAGQAAMNGIEQFKEIVREVPAINDLIRMFGMKMMNAPAVHPTQMQAPYPTAGAGASDGIQGVEDEGFDYDIVEPALAKMRVVFPDVEITLDNLATWILQNPDQAKVIFNQIKPAAQ